MGFYNPPNENEEFFISNLPKTITVFSTKYGSIFSMGDFNSTIENKHFEELLNLFNLNTPISFLSCFQSTYPACIDLILTNQGESFSNSNTCEVETSNHQN